MTKLDYFSKLVKVAVRKNVRMTLTDNVKNSLLLTSTFDIALGFLKISLAKSNI